MKNISNYIKTNYKTIILILVVSIIIISTGIYILYKNNIIDFNDISEIKNTNTNISENKENSNIDNNINFETINSITKEELIEILVTKNQNGDTPLIAFALKRMCYEIDFLEKDVTYILRYDYKVVGDTIRFYVAASEPTKIGGYIKGYNIYGYQAEYTITDDTIKYANNINSGYQTDEDIPVSKWFNIEFEAVKSKVEATSESYSSVLQYSVIRDLENILYLGDTIQTDNGNVFNNQSSNDTMNKGNDLEKNNNNNNSYSSTSNNNSSSTTLDLNNNNQDNRTIDDILNDTKYFKKYSLKLVNNANTIPSNMDNYEDFCINENLNNLTPSSINYNGSILDNTNISGYTNKTITYADFIYNYNGFCYIKNGVDISQIKIKYGIEYTGKRKDIENQTDNFICVFTPNLKIDGNQLIIDLNSKCVTSKTFNN